MRVGLGYDIHALKKGRKLTLGGIHIPYPKGLVGHSDGDAALHAIVDAVIGAMGEGDIGEHFSDKDARYKNADSAVFVEKVSAILKRKKMKIGNIDLTVIAEGPKLYPYKMKMAKKISDLFGILASQVNVKAKTNEGFGPIGQKKAVACFSVVNLIKG